MQGQNLLCPEARKNFQKGHKPSASVKKKTNQKKHRKYDLVRLHESPQGRFLFGNFEGKKVEKTL